MGRVDHALCLSRRARLMRRLEQFVERGRFQAESRHRPGGHMLPKLDGAKWSVHLLMDRACEGDELNNGRST